MTRDILLRRIPLALATLAAAALLLPGLAQDAESPEPTPAGQESPAPDEAGETLEAPTPEGDASAALEAPAPPRERHGELVRVFSNLDVPAGTVIEGDAVCIGGDARVEGRVTGDLVVVLGSLDLSGVVEGGAVTVLSDAVYREGARVERELVHVMGDLEDEGADLPADGVRMELFGSLTTMLVYFGSFELLVMLVFFVLFALAASTRVAVMSAEGVRGYGMALLVGFLIHVGVLIVNVTLILTVIGIPLAILIDIVFRVLRMFGRTAYLHAVGNALGARFGRGLSVLGAVLLGFLGLALVTIVPLLFGLPGLIVAGLVSTLLWVIFDLPAIGIVVTSQFGDPRRASPAAPAASTAPPPPAATE